MVINPKRLPRFPRHLLAAAPALVSERVWETPLKAGKMILNRFCVAEDDAFELSGVYNFRKSPMNIINGESINKPLRERFLFARKRRIKGKEHKFAKPTPLFGF